jgi:hypothetical protein
MQQQVGHACVERGWRPFAGVCAPWFLFQGIKRAWRQPKVEQPLHIVEALLQGLASTEGAYYIRKPFMKPLCWHIPPFFHVHTQYMLSGTVHIYFFQENNHWSTGVHWFFVFYAIKDPTCVPVQIISLYLHISVKTVQQYHVLLSMVKLVKLNYMYAWAWPAKWSITNHY